MVDLRVGDEVFGPEVGDGLRPKASIGAAFIDGSGHIWVLLPKHFLTESHGELYIGNARKVPLQIDLADGTITRTPSGGFACILIPQTMVLSPHPSSPSFRAPAVLEHVSIGNVSGQISGSMTDLALPYGEVEPHVILVSYANNGENYPTIGGICTIDGLSVGVTVALSRAKRLAAVVPWLGLRDRFVTLGLNPAQESDLRYRTNSIGVGHASKLNDMTKQLTVWLENQLDGCGDFRDALDPMTRLVTAIECLSLQSSNRIPLPTLPKAIGGSNPISWEEVVELPGVQEIAMGMNGELVSTLIHPQRNIVVTAKDLLSFAFVKKRASTAGELK